MLLQVWPIGLIGLIGLICLIRLIKPIYLMPNCAAKGG